jgi:hypothetical protein
LLRSNQATQINAPAYPKLRRSRRTYKLKKIKSNKLKEILLTAVADYFVSNPKESVKQLDSQEDIVLAFANS